MSEPASSLAEAFLNAGFSFSRGVAIRFFIAGLKSAYVAGSLTSAPFRGGGTVADAPNVNPASIIGRRGVLFFCIIMKLFRF